MREKERKKAAKEWEREEKQKEMDKERVSHRERAR